MGNIFSWSKEVATKIWMQEEEEEEEEERNIKIRQDLGDRYSSDDSKIQSTAQKGTILLNMHT
ncbi:hypothetical protein TIFTF001_028973 [Ficus carica]|uniref:Uncharacterized protein n=1 Tax=Ficus carica TaxID=3494 RepID=A0AA88DQY7_FICCA|nr:hypothetical protein TIFTF001_028973 [Ficus carica]